MVHPQGVTPSRGYCEEVGRLARNFRLSVLFVGDLDPLDLTNFAILATGDPDLESLSVRQMPVEYLGIDDRWLSLCESQLRRGYRKKGKTPFIAMEKGERKHFSVVKKIFPHLEELIGPKCVQLLEEGRKLEVEGAANPSFYRKEFPERLRAFLAKAPPYSP